MNLRSKIYIAAGIYLITSVISIFSVYSILREGFSGIFFSSAMVFVFLITLFGLLNLSSVYSIFKSKSANLKSTIIYLVSVITFSIIFSIFFLLTLTDDLFEWATIYIFIILPSILCIWAIYNLYKIHKFFSYKISLLLICVIVILVISFFLFGANPAGNDCSMVGYTGPFHPDMGQSYSLCYGG